MSAKREDEEMVIGERQACVVDDGGLDYSAYMWLRRIGRRHYQFTMIHHDNGRKYCFVQTLAGAHVHYFRVA